MKLHGDGDGEAVLVIKLATMCLAASSCWRC